MLYAFSLSLLTLLPIASKMYSVYIKLKQISIGVLGRCDLRDLDSLVQQISLPSDKINDTEHNPTDLPLEED